MKFSDTISGRVLFRLVPCIFAFGLGSGAFGLAVTISGTDSGRVFDGVGAVSGGGATSCLLKDYPEPYRTQILDYLFKPKFGASMNTLFFQIGGDDNATQGSEPTHMRTRTDTNFQRGYEWWLIHEAKQRNPALTIDGVAWGSPAWVGPDNFWSTDMQHYNIEFIKGMKSHYGYTLDALGCKNESGTNYPWAEQMKDSLTANGLTGTMLHGFDNWGSTKWDFCNDFASTPALAAALDVASAHTTNDGSEITPASALNCGKKLWDTEEHAYYSGWTCASAVAHDINENYIANKRITKTVFWYLIEAYYSIENFTNQTVGISDQPWSGHYEIDPGLWGYAHFNQFADVGWQFLDNACGNLPSGGTYVTLKSPGDTAFSTIIETNGATASQTLTFTITGGLPTNKTLCVWMSNTNAQFVQQASITPANGSFSITVAANSIYSVSTTTGQQKGSYPTPPASASFPFPYYENYDHYTTTYATDAKPWGYLPYYDCDIDGVFEIAERPDGTGKCLRQVVGTAANSWAPEWMPYTIIGNSAWTNYQVSADIYFDDGGWAGVMGRVNYVGDGYGCYPKGYYLALYATGAWALYAAAGNTSMGSELASGNVTLTAGQWTNVMLQMNGSTIVGKINNTQVCSVTNTSYSTGMVGLCSGLTGTAGQPNNTAMYDNLIINTVNGATPPVTVFPQDTSPPYAFLGSTTGVIQKAAPASSITFPSAMTFKIFGTQFSVPKEFAGKRMAYSVYDMKGALLQKGITQGGASINLKKDLSGLNQVRLIKLKQAQ
jgi:galactosylceramidase